MNEYCYQSINVGETACFSVIVTQEMENEFRSITGDVNPLHENDEYAYNAHFQSHVSFGMLTASFLSTLAGVYLPGKNSLIHSIDNIAFKKPVYVGDVLNISGVVHEKKDAVKMIVVKAEIRNQKKEMVLKASMNIIVRE